MKNLELIETCVEIGYYSLDECECGVDNPMIEGMHRGYARLHRPH